MALGTELFKLVGVVSINNSDAIKGLKETTEEAEKSESKMSQTFSKVGKAIVKVGALAVTASATAIAGLTKSSVEAYATFEQLEGGVQTLFKNSSKTVMKYANEAYISAGMSANEYMETVTSFSASLIQSLGGDTKKSAEIANTAIVDMSDNANKMGTSIDMIQNAYQGFAKQNYTMLDNLKLGYGGTKTEMERLVKDASKMTDIQKEQNVVVKEGSLDFANIANAIHVVQASMGILGTTEEEASETIEGSMNMMKASWANLKVEVAKDTGDINGAVQKFVDSVKIAGDNVIPRVVQSIKGIGTAFEQLMPYIAKGLPKVLNEIIPELLESAIGMVKGIVAGLAQNLPSMLNSLLDTVTDILGDMLGQLADYLGKNLPKLIDKGLDFLINFSQKLKSNVGVLIDAGIKVIQALGKGIANGLPALIAKLPVIVSNIANVINDNAPKLIMTALELMVQLGVGLIKAIPTLVKNIPAILKAIYDAFMAFNWVNLGKNLIEGVGKGIKSMASNIKTEAKKIFENVVNALKELPAKLGSLAQQAISKFINAIKSGNGTVKSAINVIKNGIVNTLKALPSQMLSIGKNLIQGLWNGISNMAGWIKSKIQGFGKGVLDALKNFFGIHSPSKVMEDQVGKNLALGVAKGIEKNAKYAKKSASELGQIIVDTAQKKLANYEVYHDMTLKQEADYWNEVRKHCKKGTQARIDADKTYFDYRKALNQALLDAETDYQNKIEEAYKKITDRTTAIINQFKLFEEYTEGESVEGSTLTTALESQVKGLEDYAEQMSILEGKIGRNDLYKALSDMGIDALEEIRALNGMTDTELTKYLELYRKKADLAKEQATSELGTEVANDMKKALNEYTKVVEELGGTVSKKYKEMKKTLKTDMTDMTNITSKQLDEIKKAFSDGTAKTKKNVTDSFNSILSTIQSRMASAVASVKSAVAEMNSALAGSADTSSAKTTSSSTSTKVKKNAEGGILTKPTIFGFTPSTNTWQLGGEAGKEAIAPIDTLQGYVSDAVASQNSVLVNVLVEILDAIKGQETTVEIDGKQIAKVVNKQLGGVY